MTAKEKVELEWMANIGFHKCPWHNIAAAITVLLIDWEETRVMALAHNHESDRWIVTPIETPASELQRLKFLIDSCLELALAYAIAKEDNTLRLSSGVLI